MSTNNIDIQQAITDISLIRQVLNKSEQEQIDSKLVGITLKTNLLLQIGAFSLGLVLCIVELTSSYSITQVLISTTLSEGLQIFGIGMMAFILVGLLIPLYFIIWRAAKHNGEQINAYIIRNFKYLNNMSFVSDLLMKFITISLVLLAGKPEWIAPLLTAFTGDYLLQNRFFTLPSKISAFFGVTCIALAFVQFFTSQYALLLPLLVFSAMTGLSASRLLLKQKKLQAIAE